MTKTIDEHEGRKYQRTIRSCRPNETRTAALVVDVYCVIEAFGVTCPAQQQAIKKLLCAGLRGKGNKLQDLVGAQAAVCRAIEMQQVREATVLDGHIGEGQVGHLGG